MKRSRTSPANTASRPCRRASTPSRPRSPGSRTFESKGVRDRDAAVRHARHHARCRPAAGDHHRDRRRAAHRHVERVDRRRHRLAQLEALPSGGRSAFLFAVTVPTVVASGDAQFNRQQDQTNASLLSLGGGARRANNYLVDGVPITDLRNRATANPSHRSARRRQRAGAPVRRRDRPHRWRHVQRRDQVGRQRVARQRLLPDASELGHGQQLLLAPRQRAEARYLLPPRRCAASVVRSSRDRTFFWASAEGYGSNTTRNAPGRVPTAREKAGDFSQTFNCGRPAGRDLRPAHGRCQRQRPHGRSRATSSREPHEPGGVEDAELPAEPDARSSATASTTSTASPRSKTAPSCTPARSTTASPTRCRSQGFYLYNLTNEPCANPLIKQSDPNAFAERNDYILKRRVHIAGAEQHLAARQQHGRHAALRLHALQRPEHAVDRVRPGAARLRPELPEPAAGQEVPARHDDRLLRDRRHRPEQADLVLAERQRRGVEAGRPSHLQGGWRLPPDRRRHAVVRGRRRSLRVRPPLHVVDADRH